MANLSNVNDSERLEPTERRVHDSNYVLNELKRLLQKQSDIFDQQSVSQPGIKWEHEFADINPNAGNGITDKFFEYDDANTNRSGPDVRVLEGGFIRTKESGDYAAGQPAIAGAAARFDASPTGDQDGWIGYTDGDDGYGFGVDADGPYVFIDQSGTRTTVPQTDWNLATLDGTEPNGLTFDETDGFLIRLPHAADGHAQAVVTLGVKFDGGGFALIDIHQFNERDRTMWDRFDLPIEWNFSGTQADGNFLAATACHYQGDTARGNKRLGGETWTPQKNSGANIALNAHPDWTYIMGMRRRSGWEAVDITPTSLTINADQNIEVQLTVRGSFSNTSFGLPDDTSDSEAATAYDLKTYDLANDQEKTTETTIDAVGEREWIDAVAGDKQNPVNVGAALDNVVLAGGDVLAMLARPATGTATEVRYAAMRNGSAF